MSSSIVTAYNDKGNKSQIKKLEIDNNGSKDYYYKESSFENNEEKIIKEDGNKELDNQYQQLDQSRCSANALTSSEIKQSAENNDENNEEINNKEENKLKKINNENGLLSENSSFHKFMERKRKLFNGFFNDLFDEFIDDFWFPFQRQSRHR